MDWISLPDYVVRAINRWMLSNENVKPHHVKRLCWEHAQHVDHLRCDKGMHQVDIPREEEAGEERDARTAKTSDRWLLEDPGDPPEQQVPVPEPAPPKRLGGRPKKTTRFYGVPWHKKEKVVEKVKKAKKSKMAKAQKP
jgi:hypothetical protein